MVETRGPVRFVHFHYHYFKHLPQTLKKKKTKKTEACSFSGETKDSSGHSKSDIDDVVKREGYLLKELSWV